jgi:hypothetical protein
MERLFLSSAIAASLVDETVIALVAIRCQAQIATIAIFPPLWLFPGFVVKDSGWQNYVGQKFYMIPTYGCKFPVDERPNVTQDLIPPSRRQRVKENLGVRQCSIERYSRLLCAKE